MAPGVGSHCRVALVPAGQHDPDFMELGRRLAAFVSHEAYRLTTVIEGTLKVGCLTLDRTGQEAPMKNL
jgi:hypothetical protein